MNRPLLPALASAFLGFGVSLAPAFAAEPLATPRGEVVLTVSGHIGATNADGAARFDLEMLRALPQTSFTTTTIWTEGPQDFTGVALHDLLDALKAGGSSLRSTAINDYAVEIPVSDAVAGGPIVAYEMNGEEMSIRDKGPLWVVYPFDTTPDYQSEVIYSRAIWQLDRISVDD